MQTDEPNLSSCTTIVEVSKELPKVIMVNSCLKKLKFHLASFDMVVKERTTTTAITKGTWGFEHTKACFRDDIIPSVKALKELFTSFDQYLIDEVTEVQHVFKQMELAVEQHRGEKNKFQNKMENVLQENYRLLTQALSVEIMNIVVHNSVKFACLNIDRNNLSAPESVPTFAELFEINELKAQAQAKDTVILKLKVKLRSLNGAVNERTVKREVEEIETLNIELDHKVTKLVAENEHLKQTYKQLRIQELLMILQQTCPCLTDLGTKLVAVTPKNKTKQIRLTEQITKLGKTTVTTPPSANIDSNTLVVSSTGVTLVSSASGSMSQDNTKKNRIWRTQIKAKKNKIEDHLRTVKSSLNKKSVVDSKATSSIINSVSNVVQIILWYLDSGCSKHMTEDRSQLVNFVQKFLGTVKFRNDHVAKIMGYGDYQIGNVTISLVYYVEGLGHNLYPVGQFYDSDLEVAFCQHTCFIRN
nr:integrase, catalytic region, zinc finger, CCHC-type, peptidase aspartic, catalytic [Tanacetum cinerariifolium]